MKEIKLGGKAHPECHAGNEDQGCHKVAGTNCTLYPNPDIWWTEGKKCPMHPDTHAGLTSGQTVFERDNSEKKRSGQQKQKRKNL